MTDAVKPLLQGLFPVRVNVGEEVFRSNMESSIKRDLPWLLPMDKHDGAAVLVAGGPSLSDCLRQLRWHVEQGHTIYAMNNTAAWLIERGIVPKYHVVMDGKRIERFIVKHPETTHLLASQCAPEVFDAAGDNVVLWHPNVEGIQEYCGDRECALIGGGCSVGLQAMSLAYTMGFRKMYLFGYDSSYRGKDGHAYVQPENDNEELTTVWFNNVKYSCAGWMIVQAEEFKGVMQQLLDDDCEIGMYGDGFLPAQFSESVKTTLTAIYDLAVSPPTYDFFGFLSEAEKARVEGGHSYLDIVFMPGPVHGFRDDNLPPDVEARKSMLQRICVAGCQLLPSVRNVHVLKARKDIDGALFPSGWTVLVPKSHYGTKYFKGASPILRATEQAKRSIKRDKPYVTITVRQSSYWPSRNSNMQEWRNAANAIESMGYDVVWVHDTEATQDVVSWDIDVRLALYEGAVCNLGVSNGPMALMVLSACRYIQYKIISNDVVSTTKEFLAAHGMNEGDQYTKNGVVVWKDDTADVIVQEFQKFISQPLEESKCLLQT